MSQSEAGGRSLLVRIQQLQAQMQRLIVLVQRLQARCLAILHRGPVMLYRRLVMQGDIPNYDSHLIRKAPFAFPCLPTG